MRATINRNPLKPRPVSATERLEGALEKAMCFAKRSRALFELGVKRGEALADVGHRLARKLDIGRRRVCLDLLGLVSAADDVHEVALRTQERDSELHARALVFLADVGEAVNELDGARKAVGLPPQLAVAGVALRYEALAWAVYSTIGKRIAKLGLSTVATTKRTFAWGLVFMLPFLPVMGFGQGAEGAGLAGLLDPVMLGNLLFLGLIASATCYVMWNKAASIVGVVNVSAYLYLTPVVTVVASVIVLAEPLTWQIVLGVALTVTGLVLSER